MNTQTLQSMERHPINLEQALILLAIAIAVAVRFLNLGTAPLTDAEAHWALQSLNITNASSTSNQLIIEPQPAYIFLTAWMFELFGATNFMARFWPALAGVLLVLSPVLFRRQLGRSAALIAVFGLALDPGLVTVSRQAGGPMMALAFSLLAMGTWKRRKTVLAGALAGLGLLSGPAVIQGALGIGIAWLAYRLVNTGREPASSDQTRDDEPNLLPVSQRGLIQFSHDPQLRNFFISLAFTILILGSAFARHPQGLAAWTHSLATYLEGWFAPSSVNPITLLAALVIFQPFALAFAVLSLVCSLFRRLSKSGNVMPTVWMLTCWIFVNLLLALSYPGRQTSDLIWVLAPLWGLAAIQLANFLPEGRPNLVSLLQTGLFFILAALFWNTLVSTNQLATTEGISPAAIRSILLLGIFLLGALTTVLIGLGWTWETSQHGLVWGLTVACLVYLISTLWGAAQLRPSQPAELWSAPPGTGQVDLVVSTLEDLSNWQTGMPQYVKIQSTVDTPSLRWALRNFTNAQFMTALPTDALPAVIITPQEQAAPALTSAYRGQDFAWSIWPAWTGALPEGFIEWLTFRKAPVTSEQIILWVRSDLFPGALQGTQD